MTECKRDTEVISAYLDGELDAAARGELESHLETCAACRERVGAQRRLGDMFAALPEVTPPGDFEARFWARIARERDAQPSGFAALVLGYFSLRRMLVLGAATAVAVLLAIALPPASSERSPTGAPAASAKVDTDLRIVTNPKDFELLQDPDMDAIADVDVLEAWDDASPG